MQLSRSLSILLFSSSVMNLSAAAAGQDARPQPTAPIISVRSPAPASRTVWLLDVSYNTAARLGASSDCDELQEQARSTGGTVLCSTDSRVPAWSAAGGLMFLDRVGFKVGYLDYGDIALHAAGDNTTMGPRPGQDGRTAVINTTFSYDAELGHARGVTLAGVVRAPLGRVVPFVEAGVWRWWVREVERSQFALTINGRPLDAASVNDDRTMASWDPVLSGGAEVWLTKMIAVNGGVRFVRLRTGNQDVNERFAGVFFGVRLSPRQ